MKSPKLGPSVFTSPSFFADPRTTDDTELGPNSGLAKANRPFLERRQSRIALYTLEIRGPQTVGGDETCKFRIFTSHLPFGTRWRLLMKSFSTLVRKYPTANEGRAFGLAAAAHVTWCRRPIGRKALANE
ncbi:Hypothetical protein NTJ_14781 [Nesidiocoris tenuis]|uniref:Uncharacterized protein n=1 Tax=Nesidiocoris tenuis TaxID=355587 RepID=A0ABN7BCA2_9HEMI|nr:Hypothetical protein NTJ_14781 [Nesidiocoris tenuis]